MIELSDINLIAKGNQRATYFYPDDSNKLIKIDYKKSKKFNQTKEDIKWYKLLKKRGFADFSHLPKYYGIVDTSLGKGQVLELIRDYDGAISKTLKYYLEENGALYYKKELEKFRSFFLDNLILFNEGMRGKNVLIRKKNEKEVEFVLIDGLGDDNWFRLPNLFKKYLEKKIVRRWNKFYKKHIKEYEEKETAR
ncbi:YrbL family protein [Aliarcobacter cryaerophilus]|jgi:hypothetical protein|uniref:YrbL family protein n=1 Tax=Aliarcobacter cryaerophilus TaxID=28198 RepID=UPI003DA4839E